MPEFICLHLKQKHVSHKERKGNDSQSCTHYQETKMLTLSVMNSSIHRPERQSYEVKSDFHVNFSAKTPSHKGDPHLSVYFDNLDLKSKSWVDITIKTGFLNACAQHTVFSQAVMVGSAKPPNPDLSHEILKSRN